ncbi:hypothetical protein PESP_a0997 [Pseudoalteromonas espejiana DSM 9414]|uniref:Transposase n=1 Tax=Pseudoalteromonas carrageenovora IAM 12662 TaxID=1314868 RepID=A0ABR9EUP2_PSEVC|nr:hypothetical protein PESP_a0997 [Pseudoalteromonas espejiana DSM 9414]MBE0383566.1 hypothetical protein [Pseudoalteromonas carrageenovora IAM 12662]
MLDVYETIIINDIWARLLSGLLILVDKLYRNAKTNNQVIKMVM